MNSAWALVYGDLLSKLKLRSRPYEELVGEIERISAQLKKESTAVLEAGKKRAFYAFCDRTIATFETRSLVNDLKKPRVGLLDALDDYEVVAQALEAKGAEAVVIGKTEEAMRETPSWRLLRIWMPIYKMLGETHRYQHLAYTKAFWNSRPTLEAYYQAQGVTNFCVARDVSLLSLDRLSINDALADTVAPHALTHAPNLCSTHMNLQEPIRLSSEQTAMIEQAKQEALERSRRGI